MCKCVSWCARDGYWTLQAVWGSQRLVSQSERGQKSPRFASSPFSPLLKNIIANQIRLLLKIWKIVQQRCSFPEGGDSVDDDISTILGGDLGRPLLLILGAWMPNSMGPSLTTSAPPSLSCLQPSNSLTFRPHSTPDSPILCCISSFIAPSPLCQPHSSSPHPPSLPPMSVSVLEISRVCPPTHRPTHLLEITATTFTQLSRATSYNLSLSLNLKIE